MTGTLVVTNVLVLAAHDADVSADPVDIIVREGRIASIAPAGGPIPPEARLVEGRGRLATPGLVNAHTHSQSSAMAGFADAVNHPAFMWLTQAHTAGRTLEEIRIATLLTAIHMIRSGSTACIDHFPGQRVTAAELDAVLSAWSETGLRAVLAVRFFDGEFADIYPKGLEAPEHLKRAIGQNALLRPMPLAELRELLPDAVARWDGHGDRLRVFPGPSNPSRCSDEALLFCAELARDHDLGIHTHLLETRAQASGAKAQYGRTMLAHLDALGVLSDRWSCAHAIWLTEDEIALMAERGAVAVHNPESNSRIGAGIMPTPAMRDAGVMIALGTDGAGANDNMDMHSAMRAAAVLHRPELEDPATWITARQTFAMATEGGAAATRRPRAGRLAAGFDADIVLHRLDAPWWAVLNDPLAQLVFAETGQSVDTVIVGGEVLMEEGRVTVFNEADVLSQAREMDRALRARNGDLFEMAHLIAGLR